MKFAETKDIDELVALSRRTISQNYRSFLGDDAVDGFINSGAVDQYVRDNIARCTTISVDGRLVGYSVFRNERIDLMMIDAPSHRQGLGTRLLEQVERTLFQDYVEIRLESFEGNHNANAFYRQNGWLEANRRFDQEAGVNKIEFRKRKGC